MNILLVIIDTPGPDQPGCYPAFLRDQADAALPGCTPLGKW